MVFTPAQQCPSINVPNNVNPTCDSKANIAFRSAFFQQLSSNTQTITNHLKENRAATLYCLFHFELYEIINHIPQ